MATTGVTFVVDETVKKEVVETEEGTFEGHFTRIVRIDGLKGKFSFLKREQVNNDAKLVNSYYQNGFVGAALSAYSRHHRLIISPDDVWISITTAFARYVEQFPEKFREHFVTHEGSKGITVTSGGGIESVDWERLIEQMGEEIKKNTINEVQEWITPNFSTTTPLTRTIGSIVLMSTLKNYFSYKFGLCCGLPEVTLLGTLDDWLEVRRRADRLVQYGSACDDWHFFLTPILDQFVEAYKGNVDRKFWNRIVNQEGGGSGPRVLTGWILCFVPFDEKGKFHINPVPDQYDWGCVNKKNIIPSFVQVPVVIDDNGKEYKTLFFAGHLSAAQSAEDPSAVQPNLGWTMLHLLDD